MIHGKQYFPVRSFTTLREMLDQSVRLYGDQTAFRFRDKPADPPQTRTYTDFRMEVDALGTALYALGLSGSRIAVVGENSYAWSLAFTTIVCGAGIAVPLDRLLPPEELTGLIRRGGVEVIFYDPQFQETLQQNLSETASLRVFVCMRPGKLPGGGDTDWTTPDESLVHGTQTIWMRLDALLAWGQNRLESGDTSYRQAVIQPDALMSLLFTSGTTSTAKAVMLSHTNVCADIFGIAGMVKLEPGTRMLSVLPLHHTFENTCGLFMALYIGAEIHVADGLRYIQKNMQEYGIDMVIGVPLLFANFYAKVQQSLAKSGKDKLVRKLIPLTQGLRRVGIDLRRRVYRQILDAFGGRLHLGICGAAPIDPEIIRFFDAVGFHILQGYGLTETAPVVCGCNSKIFVPGTVGQPVAGVDVAIDAEQPGDDGEILVRGPIVMQGYYEEPELTAEVIDADGWFHTGDLGRLDPKTKCISITGRVKSMIVLKNGKKVFPEELEYLIGQAGWIKESLVWGETGQDGDVIVTAKLVVDRERLKETIGQETDDSSIGAHLEKLIRDINARLPAFKGIRQYVFSFQEMVKTTTQKIRRPIEIGKISDLMARQKLRWQELTGKNIDPITEKPDTASNQATTESKSTD
jgi:long-chain acyl-CoA synthetase